MSIPKLTDEQCLEIFNTVILHQDPSTDTSENSTPVENLETPMTQEVTTLTTATTTAPPMDPVIEILFKEKAPRIVEYKTAVTRGNSYGHIWIDMQMNVTYDLGPRMSGLKIHGRLFGPHHLPTTTVYQRLDSLSLLLGGHIRRRGCYVDRPLCFDRDGRAIFITQEASSEWYIRTDYPCSHVDAGMPTLQQQLASDTLETLASIVNGAKNGLAAKSYNGIAFKHLEALYPAAFFRARNRMGSVTEEKKGITIEYLVWVKRNDQTTIWRKESLTEAPPSPFVSVIFGLGALTLTPVNVSLLDSKNSYRVRMDDDDPEISGPNPFDLYTELGFTKVH